MTQAAPETRSESEITSYRDMLARIHTGQLAWPITPNSIRAMHTDMHAYLPGERGKWKQRDNVIRQTLPDGRRVVRFVPLPADKTSDAIEELCHHLASTWESERLDKLLVINAFILDFLCIHPFTDGNGRMARRLTLMLLYAAGYEVGRYISLERIIEQTRETYYEALWKSSNRWDNGQHDLTPWHQYSLSVIVYAYRQFEDQVGGLVAAPGAKGQSVRAAIETFAAGQTFAIADLERMCPTVSRATIRRVLEELREQGQVQCLGTGRSAQQRKM